VEDLVMNRSPTPAARPLALGLAVGISAGAAAGWLYASVTPCLATGHGIVIGGLAGAIVGALWKLLSDPVPTSP
jgi:hypothetical protein